MKAGDPIDPSRKAQGGLYLPDIVARQRGLGDGPKRVYERLCRWAGRNGATWYGYRQMAAELGKGERQVRAAISELEAIGLIRHTRRGGRQSNLYEFLWHPWFDEWRNSADQAACLNGGKPPIKRKSTENHRDPLMGGKLSKDARLTGGIPPMNYVSRELRKEESRGEAAVLPLSSTSEPDAAPIARRRLSLQAVER